MRGVFLLLLAASTGAAALAQDGREALRARIDAALLRLGPHASHAVRVLSLGSGEVLYERNPHLSLNPASNMKLVTSAVALDRLGPGHRFTTRLLAAGRLRAGVLRGDLVLQGGGDPVLETAGLASMAGAVRDAGIRRVEGALLADDTRYDDRRLGLGWNWDDEPFYYSAQVGALGVNRNVARVFVSPGEAAGEPARVRLEPANDLLRVEARVQTVAAGGERSVRVGRARGRNEIVVSGTVPLGDAAQTGTAVTVEEPGLYAAAVLRRLLAERGVQVRGPDRLAPAPGDAVELARVESPSLERIVALLNKPSDNLVAEMLIKEIGRLDRGAGTWAAGRTAVENWLKQHGIETGGVRVHDGSGLSRLDLLTARALSDLLALADRSPWRQAFLDSLPVAAVDGTLRARMTGTAAERNVRAKTGSLMFVSGLSGYATAASGERLAFSILINHFPGPGSGPTGMKRIEDAIAVALAEFRSSGEE